MATQSYHIAALLDALVAAVDTARAATTDARWLNALNTGYSWLLEQDVITFDAARHELTVNSPSGRVYRANGACQCEAFAKHNACWHRAAARLVRRALELQAAPVANPAFRRGQRVRVVASGAIGWVVSVDRTFVWCEMERGGALQSGFIAADLEAAPHSVAERLSAARSVAMELFA